MMPRRFSHLLILGALWCRLFGSSLYAQDEGGGGLMTPSAFLGHDLGTQFTPHHRVIDYVTHVAAASPRVRLERYGETYEGRPLVALFVASPENQDRLESIRTSNVQRTGLAAGEASEASAEDGPALVWLSYNVHGNESVSTEAALATLYDLADPENERTQRWLEDVVIVLDPCLNPDGRERYVQWYRRVRGKTPNPNPAAREHHEPWPGGRMNHYYFDLNRDWAWATQQETTARLALYNRWLPHVHVDFHEQGVDDHYYFAPAAEPFHEDITAWQRSFQTTIGENNARYFDEENWLYFTREVFDLLYPGYGDTWPTFNGAIGMTYEQAGSGRAGLAIETAEGDTLTLKERIAHHHTTGLATVESAAENRARLIEEFARYYAEAQSDPPGRYAAYVVKPGAGTGPMDALAVHLDAQGLRYAYAAEEENARGFDYASGETARFTVEPGDLVVPAAQPKGRLAKVLFEPRADLADSLTYDITAWALPYAYGLRAYALTERPGVATAATPPASPSAAPAIREGTYAYLAEWQGVDDARFLGALLKQGIGLRFAREPFEAGGRRYGRGTLVITRAGNERLGERFDAIVTETADSLGQLLRTVGSGFIASGPDFGSESVAFLKKPRVALLSGAPLSPYAVGEAWHFFDRQIGYPATLMHAEDFDPRDLVEYDVLILPDGSYGEVLTEERLGAVREWVRAGGRLIALDGAVGALAGKDGFAVKRKEAKEDTAEVAELRVYAERERQRVSGNVPGAIFRARLDATHPLGYGYDEEGGAYFTLKTGDAAFAYLDEGWNVAVLQEDPLVSGFAGAEARAKLENTLVFGVEEMGRGRVVYLVDNPLFRGFWETGKLAFANAVFFVGQE